MKKIIVLLISVLLFIILLIPVSCSWFEVLTINVNVTVKKQLPTKTDKIIDNTKNLPIE
ncbi:hypothetical protein PV797_19430 [Clostridiaceae bacterium M8S5]|nr:hypothetical protein PV797_19430 [Clostridiaceae bacterium M8S5]